MSLFREMMRSRSPSLSPPGSPEGSDLAGRFEHPAEEDELLTAAQLEQRAQEELEAANAIRQVPCLERVRDWVVEHYGNYLSNQHLTCREGYYPRLARWSVDPFATMPVKVMKAGGMVPAAECHESLFRECKAVPGELPHDYAQRLMETARIQQFICKYSYVTQLSACIKFITSVPDIKPGLSTRMFQLLTRDFGILRSFDLFLMADYAQLAFDELVAESTELSVHYLDDRLTWLD
jgi:hypothetical protein